MLVKEIKLKDKEVILIGTAHVSKKSQELVKEAIEKYEPDCIGLELDDARLKQLNQGDKWKNTNVLEIIKNDQTYLFITSLILSNFEKKVGENVGTKIGSDMLTAYEIAKQKNIKVELLDRDVNVTMKRAFNKMNFLEKAKLILFLFSSFFVGEEEVSEETIEQLKKKDIMTELIEEFSKHFPSLKKVLIDERDEYIAYKIQKAECKRILAVVGAGHLEGIEKNLKKNIKIEEIKKVQKKKNYFNLLKFIVPVILVATILYILYAKGLEIGLKAMFVWFITTGSLAALGAFIARAHFKTIIISFFAAPFTTINPFLAVGWFAAFAEAKYKTPTIKDIEGLSEIEDFEDLLNNNVSRILLIGALTNLGATIGTIIALPYLLTLLV